jgi:hypothetical protein
MVLITPDAKAALETEVQRSGIASELTGGLLFGYPLDDLHRLVVSSVRLSDEVGFGQRDFSLDQTRTSRQLKHAQSLTPEAEYCGVWYIHRTLYQELTAEECSASIKASSISMPHPLTDITQPVANRQRRHRFN